ncbi:MAG TPA: hypothetical protein VD816_08290 [Ohtaekwangia sp.]|nr:hypothetical protein [Ohtaekwangia sp.]
MRHLILVLLLGLFSCEDNDPGGKPADPCMGEPDPVAMCPDVLLPVCGCDGETYNNSCYAEAAGVRSWTEGACQ